MEVSLAVVCCFLYNKVTKLKTNHNQNIFVRRGFSAVSYITKLLNWKQITTIFAIAILIRSCFLYNKVTKLKTNHNLLGFLISLSLAVSYITKLLNWKQITTGQAIIFLWNGCFLYNKVTKLKTNHNDIRTTSHRDNAVSYITKLLNWKQITTYTLYSTIAYLLFPI